MIGDRGKHRGLVLPDKPIPIFAAVGEVAADRRAVLTPGRARIIAPSGGRPIMDGSAEFPKGPVDQTQAVMSTLSFGDATGATENRLEVAHHDAVKRTYAKLLFLTTPPLLGGAAGVMPVVRCCGRWSAPNCLG